MKKLFLSMATLGLLFTACNDDSKEVSQEQQIDMSDFYVYTDSADDLSSKSANSKESYTPCYSMEVLNRQLQENPGLEKKMFDIEYQTRKYIASKSGSAAKGKPGGGTSGETDVDVLPIEDGLGTINIPVHFIVVLPNANAVTDKQIQDQLNVLNADFSSPNTNLLPGGATNFINDCTNTGISFTFAGTERHNDNTATWGTNDTVKKAYGPSSPSTTLNIWVCNIGGGILGYAQFPGGSSSTDGVVLLYSSLPGGSAAPYNLGRTATHEVGHYLNLRHIWGDGRCRQDDFVEDTPTSDGPNYGCPNYPTINCSTTDMTMNYMDYTDDACMYMFTDGQRNRLRPIFASGGPRAAMAGN